MSIHISSAAWSLRLDAGPKLVMLSLADQANDEGVCWPSLGNISRRTGMSERSVQRHLQELEAAGHLHRQERTGSSNIFVLHPRQSVTPDNLSPPSPCHPTPVTVSPINVTETSTSTSKSAKGSRWKRVQNFPSLWLTWAQEETQWSAITVHRVSDEFQDYWCAKAGAGATKADWQATWRMWIRREGKGNATSKRTGGQGGRESAVDRVARKSAEWARGCAGGEAVAADGRGVRESVVIEHGRVAESGVDQRDHGIDF